MTDYAIEGIQPKYADKDSVFAADGVQIIGQVLIGANVSLWPYVVIRGDNEPIAIGARTNIQELSLLHSDPGFPLKVGESCTVGHRAILHGCEIGDNCLIGMGAIVLNGAKIGKNSLVGAGALVTEGKIFPERSLIVGSPAKVVRTLNDDEIMRLAAFATHYVANGQRFKKGLKSV